MKANILLLGAILASSTIATTTYADNATRVAATSALGSVVGTAIGKEIGGHNGALIGSDPSQNNGQCIPLKLT
ncbi:hypothetical protein Ahae11616_09770 [Acinetobacter haemolyticus]|nr:hypothetical protein [Acinetobacter haemolyticus]NAR52267.1 hypothetical protein [Acinetobacter haemolyticus]NAR57535.1 hypothetical protein [Acinetobacter haemolyticus]NAR95609.1 hypothetical protein [Acinetobacter haemolyticus]QDJ92581.1 hypothetical protein AhaeAN54_011100 [Acinetobacter haemolyticus]QHI32922.1 hypothetical protein Ahae11616_09770 [Acinetobacter haemolyticus]